MKIVVILSITIILILTDNSTSLGMNSKLGVNLHFGMFKNQPSSKKTSNDADMTNLTKDDLPDVPIYYQGWINYFHYTKNDSNKPRFFFQNLKFLTQNSSDVVPPDDEVKVILFSMALFKSLLKLAFGQSDLRIVYRYTIREMRHSYMQPTHYI